jgi:hypothetical protein
MKKHIFLSLALGVLAACQHNPQYIKTLSPVVMENGMQVSTCDAYEQSRAAFKLAPSYGNQRASADYLICSLSLNIKAGEETDKVMRDIFHQLTLDSVPNSILSMSTQQTSLSGAGFQLWLEKSLITFNNENIQIQIQYKGQLANGSHLVWVSDKSIQPSQIKYFPAIIMFEAGKVVGAAPLYASGF